LDKLIGGLVGAINRLAGAFAKPGDSLAMALRESSNGQFPDVEFMKQRLELIHGLVFELNGKVNSMSSNLDRIEKEAADAAENVGLIRTAVENLKSASAAMQAEIASLREQVAQGQLDQARLDAAAATFEKADDDVDAIVLPSTAPIEGGGDTGGGAPA
jgi:predicted nuclease with TOPRIM domain